MNNRKQLSFLFFASFLHQVVQLGIFPILLTLTLGDLKFDAFQTGLVLSVVWIMVLVIGPFVPSLLEKYSSHSITLISSFLSIMGVSFLLFANTPLQVILSAALLGCGFIIRWILCDTLTISAAAPHQQGRAIGIHEACMGLGIGVGPLLFIILNTQELILVSLVILSIGQIVFSLIVNQITTEPNSHKKKSDSSFLKALCIGLMAAVVAGFIENSTIALLPIYLDRFGFVITSTAVVISSFGMGGTFLQPPLGILADKLGFKNVQLLCALAIIICCSALISTNDYLITVVICFLFGGAVGGLNTLAVLEAGQSQSRANIPVAMTAIAIAYTLGSIIGPIASGYSLELQNQNSLMILFLLISAIFLFAIVIIQKRTQ